MLIMFRVKNFASFKDEVILDMRAVSYENMKSHVIESEKNKVVKTLAIYGKNASGKSNLISALYYFESFVYNQFFKDENDEIDFRDKKPNVRRSIFKLSEEIDNASEFEIIFYHDQKTYQYGFCIEDIPEKKIYTIKEEWFLVNDELIFDRKDSVITIGEKYVNELKGMSRKRINRLYIGVLDYFAEEDAQIKTIIDGFKEYLEYKFNVYFELYLEGSVKGIASNVSFSQRLVEDEEYKKTVEKFIIVADVGITGLSIEENLDEKTKESDPFDIKTIHNVYNDNGEVVGQEKFDLSLESSGTIRYFSFIQAILNIIEIGGVFVVDEMSARLHPILTKFIIDLFQEEKNKKTQLIFTTHDISLMNKNQFRRDEIAFVEKNQQGKSTLYTLADINVRTDTNFSRDYLLGKYGAIPVINEESIYSDIIGDWECQD